MKREDLERKENLETLKPHTKHLVRPEETQQTCKIENLRGLDMPEDDKEVKDDGEEYTGGSISEIDSIVGGNEDRDLSQEMAAEVAEHQIEDGEEE